METIQIKELLQRYFNGDSTLEEERALETYFTSENVDEELQEYKPFFSGVAELVNLGKNQNIEGEIMDFILENELREKTRYRWLWQTVTGIAASLIIVLGGFLFYQKQQKPFDDTFKDPSEAYVYAQKTMEFVSLKYNKGLAGLSNFEKLEKASQPIKKGVAPVNEFYRTIEKMDQKRDQKVIEKPAENKKSTDSI